MILRHIWREVAATSATAGLSSLAMSNSDVVGAIIFSAATLAGAAWVGFKARAYAQGDLDPQPH